VPRIDNPTPKRKADTEHVAQKLLATIDLLETLDRTTQKINLLGIYGEDHVGVGRMGQIMMPLLQ